VRPSLFVLPFMALFSLALGFSFRTAMPELSWLPWLGWLIGLSLVGLWIALDVAGFRLAFTRKSARQRLSSGALVVLMMAALGSVAAVSVRPRFDRSWDLTRTRANTLSDQSIKAIRRLDALTTPIQFQAFFKDESVRRSFRDLLSMYLGERANIRVDYIDPQLEPTRTLAKKVTGANTLIVSYGDRETRVTTFSEEALTNAILHVLKERARAIYFLTGHGEGDPRGEDATGFSAIVGELENNRYSVEALAIAERRGIPDDAELLVIAGPRYDLPREEIETIGAWMKSGGSLLVLEEAMTRAPLLQRFLEELGLKVNQDLVLMRSEDPRRAQVGQNNAIVTEFDGFHPISIPFARRSAVTMVLPRARSVEALERNAGAMKASIIGSTSPTMMRLPKVEQPSDLNSVNPASLEAGSFGVIGVAVGTSPLARVQRERRVVFVGSVGFATNQGMAFGQNRDFVLNAANWLLQDEREISIRPARGEGSTLDLSSPGSQMNLVMLAFLYPLVFLGGGVSYWMARRRL
jgi:ABC-type uncharacterized transport system involved in gliding motility auxiliary subunit